MAGISKLVIQGTSKMTLNARFNQLAYQAPQEPEVHRRPTVNDENRSRAATAPVMEARKRARSPIPPPRFKRMTEEPSEVGLALRRLHDRSATIAAATKIMNRSITQRLGVRAWLILPSFRRASSY